MNDISRDDLKKYFDKAKLYSLITIGYLIIDVTILLLVSKNSQAMKAAWIENLLYLLPSISFLVISKIVTKPPNKRFRFGYDGAYDAGFLISSFALLAVGSFIFIDSTITLVKREVITIGTVYIFDRTIWFGWVMLAAITYSILPVYLIGKKKLELAKKLNIQMLFTDAKGQKSDWLTSIATIVGIIGIGLGIWWADAVAAIVISIEILRDGFTNIRASLTETMDRTPLDPQLKEQETLVETVEDLVKKEYWIKDSFVRLRKAGNKTTGDILIILETTDNLDHNLYELREKIRQLHWHITDVVVSPVKELPKLFDEDF